MYLVFSDLDGTLLDHDSYDYTPAKEGLELLRKLMVPLVLVSSKTLPEMELLQKEIGIEAPFIFENGGGIFWPGRKESLEYLGMDVSDLKEKRELLEETIGERVHFITDMNTDEIVKRTGLSRERALLSQQRLTSLPFILSTGKKIGPEKMVNIDRVLRLKGFSVTKGGRFYHFLSSRSDKGSAINRVIEYYREKSNAGFTTIGIGDSENDIAMFRVVDIPVAVRKKDGTIIDTGMDHVRSTSGKGPVGFSEAIKKFVIINGNQGREQR